MARKNLHYYLIKAARLSGWLLLPLMVLFIVTGFALRNEFGFNGLLTANAAAGIHQLFEWPLIVVFAVHVALTIYFALRRWGWIKKRNCP